MERIPIAGPWITQKEISYVTDAVTNAWYSKANIYHERFEKAFADYLGVRFAMTLPSCTSALHLSLLALGIGPGDEVIVPEITWIATAAPVTYVGATLVFADIDPHSWCLSPESCEACITPRTKAMIPVDLYGNIRDMDKLRLLATKYHLAIIEDAAEAIGSEYRGRKAGSLGDIGAFSFHGTKALTTGEGGMLVTDREDVYHRALFLANHAQEVGDKTFFNYEVGYKYKMSSMQAALGLAQLERIEELVTRKREIFSWYRDELSGAQGVTLNDPPPDTKSSYWMVTVVLDKALGIGKYRLIHAMDEKNIDCRPFFHPLSSLPAYATLEQSKEAPQRNPISYQISPFAINLPSGFNMTPESVRYVCESLKEIVCNLAEGVSKQ